MGRITLNVLHVDITLKYFPLNLDLCALASNMGSWSSEADKVWAFIEHKILKENISPDVRIYTISVEL